MLHKSLNMNPTQNLSPILKNFNVYDVLEPEKINVDVKENVPTDILVDICDIDNERQNSSDLSPDLHGSFLDKVKKSEFDLLDLFQNIYVTPAEIKKNSDDKNKMTPIENIGTVNIDYTKLFEKAEQGENLSHWKEHPENGTEECSNTKVKVLDRDYSSKLIIDPAPKFKYTEPNPMYEDEIDNVLRPKRVLKAPIIIKETVPISSIKPRISHDIDVPQKTSLNNKIQNQLKNNEETFITQNGYQHLKTEKLMAKSFNHDDKRIAYTSQDNVHLNENKKAFSSKIDQKYCHEIKASLVDLNSPSVYSSNCQNESIPILQTVKLDTKVYSKRHIVKNDSEKIGFTKGPDIYEKSVVLPQIMKRLADRKQALGWTQNVQRKLILETYNSVKQIQYPTETTPNKNCIIKPIPSKSESPKMVEFEKFTFRNEEETMKLENHMLSHKPEVSLKSQACGLESADKVTLEPIVLMEDCSKKRMAALNARIAFEKFVLGKPP
ncbi:uncharacterized protein LOC112046161 [Bicyclus anynana]|uniref:Uncharacterized protein LOC112046161 n=1 Tax=Bicyclus anynana TaxID=110368 RepID=A0A6J1MZV9_BICAN|nr:uncharacterized protein LOC112046161 [Bicyclus anynana]XP_023938450.1 uncharacterized protein LOC112046161 [Bicyclus anynana]XP_023938452.1 uncharacterized protein LOC112046161 [Bicyclus anynana]XP_052746230.1 uncharacterized protein LOC112046161 [Bicyclus anynana]XP_052746231.1 uncharacterized protein LOC112046161 [Bicyclus anynana]XP_052746232.1 uncharacterized protein LOC112046161 [Bicyclus anynana]XP_052746233.1 uncharacterized protein LOC112046161 [Bicyclus anynana]